VRCLRLRNVWVTQITYKMSTVGVTYPKLFGAALKFGHDITLTVLHVNSKREATSYAAGLFRVTWLCHETG
jgi:hypothetical protein